MYDRQIFAHFVNRFGIILRINFRIGKSTQSGAGSFFSLNVIIADNSSAFEKRSPSGALKMRSSLLLLGYTEGPNSYFVKYSILCYLDALDEVSSNFISSGRTNLPPKNLCVVPFGFAQVTWCGIKPALRGI